MLSSLSTTFPTFELVDEHNFLAINKLYETFEPYSDFSPTSLLCWNADKTNSFATHNDNLIIKLKDYLSPKYMYSVLGTTNIQKTLNELFKLTDELNMVPEATIQAISEPTQYAISEERDNFDYVLAIKDLAGHTGGDYRNLRKHFSAFCNNFAPQVEILDLTKPETADEILKLSAIWCQNKGFDSEKIQEDITSIKTFLKLQPKINTIAVGLRVSGHLVGYTLNELINKDWVMGHFGNALSTLEYASIATEIFTAQELEKTGHTLLNHQQDTGIAGLRINKMALHPKKFLKKYTLKKL